jgi:hypothetical protein
VFAAVPSDGPLASAQRSDQVSEIPDWIFLL